MKAKIEKGILHIEIEVEKELVASSSGKTLIVASSHGNTATNVIVQGKPVVIGVNAFIKP